ncbi:BolA family transcriptional regulator [Achromobacter sp. GG226]|uniref:BolA family protein n=1 Tax=Verticiella alkaliphila TaxID=2779529 RepID=UPI001C0D5C91|nr:BolA family protein [Verticiella sp. GG226]MBU4610990.1 BolA family transcriptional regulator [Verticiella sp. GG226]
MTNPDRAALIESRLAALSPASLRIEDESHLHAGHEGARGGAGHYRVHICAECFRGQSPVARHRLVYDRLADLIPHEIHALAIHASLPESPSKQQESPDL